ncbi:hypothetical protein GGR56DRAFT_670910 [Xylariaceae sp. FL0804]|nr:hypothetical protein GGR56DRAFT_670910 [Xylariaceae sp. FL0804]
MAPQDDRRRPAALNLTPSRSSSEGSFTSTSSLKPPRTPRFAEATAIHSPIEQGKNPFGGRDVKAQAQPADVGFGYINDNTQTQTVNVPMTPKSPLKSAMRVPGTPARKFDNPLSPTFREEEVLEKQELDTEKIQAQDLGIKYRVRLAKFALRGVSFSCSLIILAMLSASFTIFRATKDLTAESSLPAWAEGSQVWPQYLVLGASCVNLLICILIFVGYCRGGHYRAEKVGVYYTLFAVGWFIVSMIMWAAAAGILQLTKNSPGNKNIWGWACTQNTRSEVFQKKVDYALVCRLQNWSLICVIIEVVIDTITVILYSVVFYRYYTKRKLMKSMDLRDRARSDLYLAQLRSQSAPNTPGFGPKSPAFSHYGPKSPAFSQSGPKSPAFSQYALSPRFPPNTYTSLGDIAEGPTFTPGAAASASGAARMAEPQSSFASQVNANKAAADKPFKLQAPPVKAPSATPRLGGDAFRTPTTPNAPQHSLSVNTQAPAAPGEQQYASVPIPGAYADAAVKSPGFGQYR